jgi:hypothetical protein
MANEVPQNGKEAAAAAPVARQFRRFAPPSSLTPEQCRRQTMVLRAACEHLFPRGTAIAFLNTHHRKLGGKPLQVALESDDGLLRVEQLLARISQAKD